MGDIDLRTTLGAAPIQRDVVLVQGDQAIDYLQGQLSQDVAKVGMHEWAPSLLLQPSGKVVAWLRIKRSADIQVVLDVEAGFGEAIMERLQRFKLRTKVDLTMERWSGLAVRGPGATDIEAALGAIAVPAGWPGVEGVDLLSPDELALAGVALATSGDLEALRIECGVPAMGAELTETTIPAEAGQWLIDASVSFTKGCYTGQELVARIDSRGGNVPRPLRGLLVEGDPVPAGTVVRSGEADVGVVTSTARSEALGAVALALVARSTEPDTRVELTAPDGHRTTATVSSLPMR